MDEKTMTKPGRGARFWVTIMLGGAAALVVLCVGVSLGAANAPTGGAQLTLRLPAGG